MSCAVEPRDLNKSFNTLTPLVRAACKRYVASSRLRVLARLVRLLVLGISGYELSLREAIGSGLLGGGLPALICGALTAVVSATLNLVFSAIVSVCGWLVADTSPICWLWQRSSFMFRGMMSPLDTYPDPMRAVAGLAPFPSLPYGWDRIALGAEPPLIVHTVTVLAGWTLFGALAAHFAFRRALNALDINRG